MRRLVLFLLSLVLIVSCHEVKQINTDGLLQASSRHKLIYISDLSYESDSLYADFCRISKEFTDYDFYRCDCGDSRNYPVIYSHDISVLPAVLVVSDDVSFSEVLPQNVDFDLWLRNWQGTETRMLCNLRCHLYLDAGMIDDVMLIRDSVILQDSFYSCYLMSRVEFLLGNLASAENYVERAIHHYYNHPEQSKSLLFSEILSNHHSEAPIVMFDSLVVDFGTITESGVYENDLEIRNYGSQPFLILQAVSSCDCVGVKYNKILPPNGEGVITVTYKSSGTPTGEKFERLVYLVTNSYMNDITITVRGIF